MRERFFSVIEKGHTQGSLNVVTVSSGTPRRILIEAEIELPNVYGPDRVDGDRGFEGHIEMQLLESLAEPRNGGIICLQCRLSRSDDRGRLSVDVLSEELRDSSHI